MKLLIVTQKVNTLDPVLSFFHRWIREFAKRFEFITVICLEMGKHDLPENVKVLSLGKEEKQSRLQYLIHFYWHVQHERKNYDAVFVHMNQEYLLLAGWLWRLWGKKVTMWRNHYEGSVLTDIAAFFCHRVFCTSAYSYTAKYRKTRIMPGGVDTDLFAPNRAVAPAKNSILFVARMAPSKRPELLLEALSRLKKDGVRFTASFYGEPSLGNEAFYQSLKDKNRESGLEAEVVFHKSVPNDKLPDIYPTHEIFVNASPSGMYDKTIFEAMACGCLAMTSNENLKGKVGEKLLFEEGNAGDLASKLKALMYASEEEKDELRKETVSFVRENHSLQSLAAALRDNIESI